MANFIYDAAKQSILEGEIDVTNNTLKLLLVSSGYAPNQSSHQFVSNVSVSNIVHRSAALQNVTNIFGVLDADDIVIADFPGTAFDAFVIYIDTGSDATSRLLAYIDESSGIPFAGAPSPAALTIVWNNGATKIIALTDADARITNTILYGSVTPPNSLGIDGDFYINTATPTIFGPKIYGAWPAGTSITGPTGETGPTGLTGPTGYISDLLDVDATPAYDGEIFEFDGTNWVNAVRPSSEPIGFENKDDSEISFDESNRIFSIAPASVSYTVWCSGKRYIKTTSEIIQIPDTSGLYYIYFDSSGSLAYKTTFFTWNEDTPTAYIYWNDVNNKAYFFADERHGVTLDWATHEYLHRTRGAAIANGFGANNYTTTGNGSSDSHCQIDIADGTFFDEDLQVDITNSATPTPNTWEQVLQGAAEIPIFYKSGSLWVKDVATTFPLKTGTNRPAYNLYSGGNWTTPDIQNNHFGATFIIATNNLNEPIIGILGQSSYTNKQAAEAEFYESLNLDDFPVVEFRPLYKVVYECRTSYTNAPSAAFVSVTDLRSIISGGFGIPTVPVADHGNLTGLSDDDHTQYVHTSSNRTITASHTFSSNTIFDLITIEDGVKEKFQTKADATGTVDHNCSSGFIFYHTSPDANWTVNLTNLDLSSTYATAITLIIVQGGTGYYPNALEIAGAAQTINWQGNTTPTPSTNRTDIVTFSIINNAGTYSVFGQLTGF